MDVQKILEELRRDRDNVLQAIQVLQRLASMRGRRRGRPPKWMTEIQGKRRGRPPGSKNTPTDPTKG